MKYRMIETKNGRIQYWNEHGMVKKADMPEALVKRLLPGMEIEIDAPSTETPAEPETPIVPASRDCFIDGAPGKFKKFLEQKMVYLCEEHYRSLTTGEVVFEMRKAGLLTAEDKEKVLA